MFSAVSAKPLKNPEELPTDHGDTKEKTSVLKLRTVNLFS